MKNQVTSKGKYKIKHNVKHNLKHDAFQFCHSMAGRHYENFPVASLLIPKTLRTPIVVIYAFARNADDIADEGLLETEQRIARLGSWERWLMNISNVDCKNVDFDIDNHLVDNNLERLKYSVDYNFDEVEKLIAIALRDIIHTHAISKKYLMDLLSAFKQDLTKCEYKNFTEILDYCQRSANPIGRLLLELTHQDTPENFYYSDCICTALQLINFIQDIESDLRLRKRCYLPLDEMKYDLKDMQKLGFSTLMQAQLDRIEALLHQGKPLGLVLKGRLGLELRVTIALAFRMIQKLTRNLKSSNSKSSNLKSYSYSSSSSDQFSFFDQSLFSNQSSLNSLLNNLTFFVRPKINPWDIVLVTLASLFPPVFNLIYRQKKVNHSVRENNGEKENEARTHASHASIGE